MRALPPDRDSQLRHAFSLSDADQIAMLTAQFGEREGIEQAVMRPAVCERRPLVGRLYEDGNALVYEPPSLGGSATQLGVDDSRLTVLVLHSLSWKARRYKDKDGRYANNLRDSLAKVEPYQGLFTVPLGMPLKDWTPDYLERLIPRIFEFVPKIGLYQDGNTAHLFEAERYPLATCGKSVANVAYWTDIPDDTDPERCLSCVLNCRRFLYSFDAWIRIRPADINEACREWFRARLDGRFWTDPSAPRERPASATSAVTNETPVAKDEDDLDAFEKAARRTLHGEKAIPPTSGGVAEAPKPTQSPQSTGAVLAQLVLLEDRDPKTFVAIMGLLRAFLTVGGA